MTPMPPTSPQPAPFTAASGTGIAAPFPLAVVTEQAITALGVTSPCQVTLSSARKSSSGWLYSSTHYPHAAAHDDRAVADDPTAGLTAGIAAPLRAELGIPRRTVVTVRRRLLPRIAGRANDLTVPLGGLVVAALAIQGFRIYWVALGSVMILALSLLPLRHRRPPRGRWR